MAHPYHHAVSSARIHGGRPGDYLAFHGWFDASKALTADPRHRLLRHHREGIEAATATFGSVLPTADGGVDARAVGEQHVMEDLGRIPEVADWTCLGTSGGPERRGGSSDPCPPMAARWGGDRADYARVVAWFDEHERCGGAWGAMRHHAEGIFRSEEAFGVVMQVTGGKVVPTRWIGERLLAERYGRIPTFVDWVGAIRVERWMCRAARKLSQELDR